MRGSREKEKHRHKFQSLTLILAEIMSSALRIDPSASFRTPSVARILSHPFSLFYRMWPVAALGVALIFNVVWIGFHGFELFKLIS